MYISYIKKAYKGDTFFPEWNKEDWKEEERQEFDDKRQLRGSREPVEILDL